MDWLTEPDATAALTGLLVCGVLGWLVPLVVGRLPEPEPEPTDEPAPEPVREAVPGPGSAADSESDPPEETTERALFERSLPPAPPKESYAAIAALPGLASRCAVAAAVVGALAGAAVGWSGALLYLLPLVPIGVGLLVVDWRTTLLPTRIIHPTYLLLAVLIPAAAWIDGDLSSLYRAGWGWLVLGGWFWLFWWLFNAWGFGDVRLARVLGPALGYLGWTHLLMGLGLIVVVGGLGGLAVGLVRGDLRGRVAYGPFMLIGAALSVLIGPWLATTLGY